MVGEILKKAREKSGKDIREISEILKIRYAYLMAIEEEDFGKLPTEVYVKGYLREYAELLNINPEEVINAYNQEFPPVKDEKTEIIEKKETDKRKHRYLPIFIALIVIGLFTFILLPREKTEMLYPPIEIEKETLPQPPEPKIEPPQLPVENKSEVKDLKEKKNLHVLEIFAEDTTWLLVDIDNTITKDVILRPGDSVRWEAKSGFSIKIGNAGGVKLVFNGKEIEKLGKKGQVITIRLP
ncbi:MAG: RodZ domain-containing protein [Nitrospirota bacterium]